MQRYQAYLSKVQKINRLDKRTKEMTIGDVIKKSILPLAFMVFWFWMTKTIMKVSGQTDWFWWVFIAGLPFGIHKMRLILIPRGMDTTATLGMAALSVIIGYKYRIRVILAEKMITNTYLAEQLGVSKMTISRWCTNTTQPSAPQLIEISRVLQCDLKDLYEIAE